jgi:hypothetical protein
MNGIPLRRFLSSQPELVQDLELAAEQRYWEGMHLMAEGRWGAGIYLMGYATEMVLKAAVFRTDGASPADDVRSRLGPARVWGGVFLPNVPHESYHSLWFWYRLLRQKRQWWGRPIPWEFDQACLRGVRSLYSIWWVEMRYRPDNAGPDQADVVYEHTTWLLENRLRLWR